MKLKSKLELAGINPAEIGGYRLYDMEPGKDRLINKVLDMQGNRDRKVAAAGFEPATKVVFFM